VINILLIEDNPGDARLIAETLRDADGMIEPYTITHVERVSQAVTLLRQPNEIDLILSDLTLPDSSGVDTLDALAAAGSELPVIFMTGTNDEALSITAIHKGAQDYLIKGAFDSNLLAKSLRYARERKRVQNQMQAVLAADEINRQKIAMLAEQKRQLIKLNRAKDEFISIASHQLRTPATAVKQYIGMITEGFTGDVTSAQLDLLNRAYASNERELNVIDELLKTAQLDSNRYQLKLEKVNLNELIGECVEGLRATVESKGQVLTFQRGADAVVTVDRSDIKLALDNLIENASKYTPHNRRITVKTEPVRNRFTVRVCDEGVGIAKSDHKLIFDKFSRVNNELSDTVTGTGLGLYWVRRIIRLHKGTIRVESSPGKGSEFVISLPLEE
jgi:signal transduction histidine kinase